MIEDLKVALKQMEESEYSKRQVLDRIHEAENWLFDSQRKLNFRMEQHDLRGAINCLAGAHNMLKDIYDSMDKEKENVTL